MTQRRNEDAERCSIAISVSDDLAITFAPPHLEASTSAINPHVDICRVGHARAEHAPHLVQAVPAFSAADQELVPILAQDGGQPADQAPSPNPQGEPELPAPGQGRLSRHDDPGGALSIVCWNVEGKSHLSDLDIPVAWDILLLQEVSSSFTAPGHVLKRANGAAHRLAVAVVVHRRHAAKVTAWGGERFPHVYLQELDMVVSSVYMPSISRSSEEWEDAIRELRSLTSVIAQRDALLVVAGDFNASWLADSLGSGAHERPLAVHRRMEESVQRASDLLSWLDDNRQFRIVVPEGGIRPTFVPYNIEQQSKVLDYIFCGGSGQKKQRVRSLSVCDDWVLRTGHCALHLLVSLCSHNDLPGERDPSDPMRYAKMNRRRKVRRKWPGWAEATPSQLSGLIPDAAWDNAEDIQRALRWAGRAAATRRRNARKATPFDPLEAQALSERRVTQDRKARRILALWVLKIRGHQKRWRYEQTLEEYTARGRSMAKDIAPAGLVLSPSGDTTSLCSDFKSFWTDILRTEADAPQDAVRPQDGVPAEEWAQHSPTPRSDFDLLVTHEEFVSLLHRLPKGKAAGDDGVVGEFVQALRPDHYGRLLELLSDTLLGRAAVPPGWRTASVSLIPKILGACAPRLFRPITVLPVLQKVGLRAWLVAATPYLKLRSQASHGFRREFQAAELQLLIRSIMDKRLEWNLPFFVAKLDIAKAFDSVSWDAICWLFERRNLPAALRAAYWRMHVGRELVFRTGDGMISFPLEPRRGMAQGAPESPLVFAALMEELLDVASAILTASGQPVGVPLPEPEEEDSLAQVESNNRSHSIFPGALTICNFADDCYLFGRSAVSLSFSATVVSQTLRHANQHVAADKSEVLTTPGASASVRVWNDTERQQYEDSGRRPPPSTSGCFKPVLAMTVLGTKISAVDGRRTALEHRIQCAWRSYSGIRQQLKDHSQPLRARVSLLDSVVLSSLLWGLESLAMNKPDKQRIRGLQRIMVGRCIRIGRRAAEDQRAFHRRRTRVVTAKIHKLARGFWDELQEYRHINFLGHICRLADSHVVTAAFRWRNLSWWHKFRRKHPTRMGGQPGRRRRDHGNPCRGESHIARRFSAYKETAQGQASLAALPEYAKIEDWSDLALFREHFKQFSKWAAFQVK